MSVDALKLSYQSELDRAQRLRTAVTEQITRLFEAHDIALGVPLESRVKTWESLEEKLRRKALSISQITDLDDLVGVRAILLFRKDVDVVHTLLSDNFSILSTEDTSSRLSETQFGYQSRHYVAKLPSIWLKVPSLSDLGGLKVELQIRTLAQHIWAAASHKLQYKQEHSVPPPIRRTIHRVSALLETVDLEFDRVLAERKEYVDKALDTSAADVLNVDLLAALLSELLPQKNYDDRGTEPYADLLNDLLHFKVASPAHLKEVIVRHRTKALKADAEEVASLRRDGLDENRTTKERLDRGVFFTHVGLAREALRAEFPEYRDYLIKKAMSAMDTRPPKRRRKRNTKRGA